jgi:hypothetical protein
MIPLLLTTLTLALGQGATLADIARAQALISTGDVLEGSLVLREVAESDEAEPAARDVARYYLGVLRLGADDVEGARGWFDKIEREPADARLRLSLAFRRGECEARLGNPDKVVATVAPRLAALQRAYPGELPAAEVAFLAVQLGYGLGHPEWVPALTGGTAEAAFSEIIARGTPDQMAALAGLPGVPPDVLARIRAAHGAGAAVTASMGQGAPVAGEEQLTGEFPSLAAPAAGGILVPAPLTGPQAAYGLALQRVLTFVAAERGGSAPWRFVDTGAPGWTETASTQLAAGDVSLVLGPLGARSLAELEPLLRAHPVPVLPLFPAVSDRAVAFPLLPLVFDLEDELRALFAAEPLAAGARVAVVGSEGAAARGLDDVLAAEVARAGGQVVHTWTLPADPKAQVAHVAGWVAEAAAEDPEPGFDVLFLATGPAEGLRVLSLLHFQGVPLESSPAYAQPAAGRHRAPPTPVRLYALHTVLGRGFLDPVTHLSRGVRVADPCAAVPERLAALELVLGRPAFAIERWAAHLAQVVLQARDETGPGSVLDLARLLASTRRWSGLCGTLDVQAGKGAWELRAAPFDALPPAELPAAPAADPAAPSGTDETPPAAPAAP